MSTSKGLSWVIALGGLWEIISPFVLGYSNNTGALWDSIIIGIVLLVLGVWSALTTNPGTARVLDWINFILGLWLIISSFVLGFSSIAIAMWDLIIVGIIVAVLGIVAALSVRRTEPIPHP